MFAGHPLNTLDAGHHSIGEDWSPSQGSLGEGNRRVGFVFTPLTSAEVAETQRWEKIIHLSVAASGTLADHQ
jgi:hypothetical protein